MSKRIMMTFLVLSLSFTVGCKENPVDTIGPFDVELPPRATTKIEALDLFKDAYSGMNLDHYLNLLHVDFAFVYQDDEDVIHTLDFNDEKHCTANMFYGEAYTNQGGVLVGGISDIRINYWDVGSWALLAEDDPLYDIHPDAESVLIKTEIVLTFDDPVSGDPSVYTIQGMQYLVVAPEILNRNLVVWNIVQHVDKASGVKSSDPDMTWGEVKARYI